MNNKLINILWITDYSHTGYTNASRTLIRYLNDNEDFNKRFKLYIFGINHNHTKETILKFKEEIMPWFPIENLFFSINENLLLNYSQQKDYNTDPFFLNSIITQRYGLYDLERVCVKTQPHIILSINDNGVLYEQIKLINGLGKKYVDFNPLLLAYMPIDCYEFPKNFFHDLEMAHELITMTEFGKKEILNTGFKKPVHVLNHSIDNENFYPLNKNKITEIRYKLFNEKVRDRFLILNSNKNQNRKRLDLSINIYKMLIDRGLNVGLILKTSKGKSLNNGGLDLDKELTELSEKYKEGIQIIDKQFTLEELNELYNAIDVNINTSIGEGWGIVPCEVGLCEVPQLVPNSTSYPEIFDKECLVECDEILRIVGMNEMTIDDNSFNCILKGTKRYFEFDEVNKKIYDNSNDISNNNFINDVNNNTVNNELNYIEDGIHYNMDLLKQNKRVKTVNNIDKSIDIYRDVAMVPFIPPTTEMTVFNIMISDKYSQTGQNMFQMSNGMIIKKIYKDSSELIDFLIDNKDELQNFQVLCQNGKNMNELRDSGFSINENLEELSKHYKLQFLDADRICKLTVKVGLPKLSNFADKIEALYRFPELKPLIGKKCRNKILNEFNISKVGEKLVTLLNDICNKEEYKHILSK